MAVPSDGGSQPIASTLGLARGRLGAVARRNCKRRGLCHSGSVTYDPGRRAGRRTTVARGNVVAYRCCATSGGSRCAHSATRCRRTGRPRSNRDDAAGGASRPGSVASCRRTAGAPMRCRCSSCSPRWWCTRPSPGPARPNPAEAAGPDAGPADHRRRQHRHHRRAAEGADSVRRQPADRDPARRRAVHRGGRQDLAHRAGRDAAGGQGTAKTFTYTVEVEDGVDTTPSAATRGSRGWSARRWPTPRAGRTTRSSRSRGSTAAQPDFRVSLTRR